MPVADRPRHQEDVDSIRELLGEPAFADAWEAGQTLTVEEVLRRHARLGRERRHRLSLLEHAEQPKVRVVRAERRIAARDPQRPRGVRAIAGDPAADVEHDGLAGRDDALRRGGMRRPEPPG